MMDDELLSAYVDGELSGPELATVEARLRDDPQARKLVEDLRGVSATLRALPRHRLSVDLREIVLQQELVHPHSLLEETEEGSDRRWVWAVMAIAAAFFLAVYMPNTEQDQQEVARAEGKRRDAMQAAPHLVGPIERPREAVDFAAGGVIAPGETLPAEVYRVFLSPGSPDVSVADFDRLLASHGIAVRNESAADSRAGGPELVLVEAPVAGIQQIIAACAEGGSPWRSPRVIGQDQLDGMLGLLADQRPVETGVAIAVDSLDLEGDSSVAKAEMPEVAPSAVAPARGWATHLGHGSAAPRALPTDGHNETVGPATVRVLFILDPAAE